MLKIIAAVVGLLVVAAVGVLVVATTRADNFEVQRSARIKAPPEKIFAFIEDFHKWGAWSPYEKLDPTMKRSYDGPPEGKGAVYAWDGSGKVGAGRMEILEAPPPSKIVIKLDFLKPFEGHNTAEFTLAPEGDTTNVTWSMRGPQPFVAKVMGLFLDMDDLIGKDFAAGLANLKAVVEQ